MADTRARVPKVAMSCVGIAGSLEFTTSLLSEKTGEEDAGGLANLPYRH